MLPKPKWLKVKAPAGEEFGRVRGIIGAHGLHTVCQSAKCPNVGECWNRGTATFLILGNVCTRACGFCNIATGRPKPLDEEEPARVARATRLMGLRHVVITSVDRDDLPDGGAEIWARTVEAVREAAPEATIETLIPDFRGRADHIDTVLATRPDVLNHNVETVPRLYRTVRPQAKYPWSLSVLGRAAEAGLTTKTGFMLGLGERPDEVHDLLRDVRGVGVSIVTIGQYLQPTREHLPVARYVDPSEFEAHGRFALELGFSAVESAPLVRSSYHAEAHAPRRDAELR